MTNWISDDDGYLNAETGYRVRVDKDGFYAVDLPVGSPLTWFGADSFCFAYVDVAKGIADRLATFDPPLTYEEVRAGDHRLMLDGDLAFENAMRDGGGGN